MFLKRITHFKVAVRQRNNCDGPLVPGPQGHACGAHRVAGRPEGALRRRGPLREVRRLVAGGGQREVRRRAPRPRPPGRRGQMSPRGPR